MQKITAMPSCPTEAIEASAQLSESASESSILSREGYRRVRRSAAMIGLAISMSATSMLLPNKNEAALAVESVPSTDTLTSLPKMTPVTQESSPIPGIKKVKLVSAGIQHEVQQGESLWQLSEEYQVAPSAIANSNKISPQTELIIGQTLKIPALPNQEPNSQDSPSLKTSLSNLRETRTRLQDSLRELKSEKTKLKTELASVSPEIADVSQSNRTRITALSTDRQAIQSIEIPVPTPESELIAPTPETERNLRRSIPVAIPTPTSSGIRQGTIPLNPPTPFASPLSSLPPKEDSQGTSPLSSLETSPSVVPTKQKAGQFNHPIPIPVPSPETASLATEKQRVISTNPINPRLSETTPGIYPLESPQPRAVNPVNNPVYQIKPGDTLNTIARRYGLSVSELIQANGIGNPNLIKVHQSLVIPQKLSAQKTRQNPKAIANIPLAGSRLNVPQSQLSQPSVLTSNPAPDAQEIPVESSTATYTERLKADFTSQPRTNPNHPTAIPIAVQPVDSDANSTEVVVGESVNSEWSGNHPLRGNISPEQTQLPGYRQETQTQTVQPSLPPVSSNYRRVPSRDNRSQSQLVGTAPMDAEQYNEPVNIPVGEPVGPEFPSFSVPGNYFPGTPTNFGGYMWPTKGIITSGFGRRWGRMHKGIDIAGPIGTPVMAAASGEVIAAGWNSGGYGNLVKIQHLDGSITLYGHNSRVLVRRGQIVQQGEQISEMGSTGFSTGPHLHFEVHPDGKAAVNPIAYLPGVPRKQF